MTPSRTVRHRLPAVPTLVLLALALAVIVIAACSVGAFPIATGDTARILLSGLGLASADGIPSGQQAVLWSIRLPRVVLGVIVGGGLGAAGAAMQALFRNPLADPSLTGVSGGAALAATSVIVTGVLLAPGAAGVLGVATLPLAAFAGGLAVSVVVYRLATRSGHTSIAALLLAGVAMNALAEAGIGMFTFIANDDQLRNLTFWRLGSVAGGTWPMIACVGPAVLIAVIVLVAQALAYDALALGEAEAAYLGVRVERLKALTLVFCALAAGSAVAVSGMVLFVGLVAPHLVRRFATATHGFTLLASAATGGTLLLAADVLARSLIAPQEVPVGVLTALLGGSYLIWLLHRRRAP